ncbi:MAG TPA: FAD-dependent oxidoreductase [Nocardioides sp.]|uniref:NAD(P)/FAD-dependent oxidoreductase n=1 Tax=Nocardioides sp. TaxID=35761 RepID=UPI002D807C3D|nr:FAD-dependent oxidoreductase [Nocardioides sp.]HET6654506.1 FAD-dependent oxidoreductase [Nocardioides sp.]
MVRPTVAVIGAGISGLTAAHVLSRTHTVTVLEADDRLGGHAHTHDVPSSDGRCLAVDSGFIVHNERTYPHLLRLFSEIGVQTRPTEMSMSITCSSCGLSYAGGRGARGIFAQPARLADPRFLRLLTEVPRFHRAARAMLADDGAETTWGDFLAAGSYSDHFVEHFAIPLVSCVWSAGDSDALAYPARHLFRFLDHHGMLSVTGSPTWRTVVGGSRTYVEALAARLTDVRRAVPVAAVTRHSDGVDVSTATGSVQSFDRVVVATHADQALDLLADASPEEKQDLAAITYSVNRTWLHTDSSVLPSRPGARASWNYRMSCGDHRTRSGTGVVVSYWMNRLQGLEDTRDHVVTLNAAGHVNPSTVVAEMTYAHPVFTPDAVTAAARLRTAGGDRLAFAGAHLGWGFHEDGCRSGVEAAARFGASW